MDKEKSDYRTRVDVGGAGRKRQRASTEWIMMERKRKKIVPYWQG